jgi:cellulose synthase/poly-beta-1,6-N-acetylglucosamine synthase-like glycosyltransferase
MELTVIISYYKALDNLKLILMALNRQSKMNFEVILSEDDNNNSTVEFLSEIRNSYNFPIKHIFQKSDNGFRKNEMLNKSILESKTDKLVFIDGDCVPHKHFIKNYINSLEEGFILDGRAVMLSENITKYVKVNQSLKKLNIFNLLFTNSQKIKNGIYFPFFPLSNNWSGRGLVGRNWGVYKKHLVEINGFDSDYVYAGVGEDVDIEWRLKANGLKSKSMKNKSIVYHLFHEKGYSETMVQFNFELFYSKQKANHIICLNGLKTIGDV